MNMDHRLNGHNLKAPAAYSLSDAVDAMTDRATSIVALLQSEYTGDSNIKSTDEIIFNALEAVYLELKDIKEVVDNFHIQQQKK